MEKEMITITAKEYDSLKRSSAFLDCLEGAGVDNWDGWCDAMDDFRSEYPDGMRS